MGVLVVYVFLDGLGGETLVLLLLRFQRNVAAHQSSLAVLVHEAVEIVGVSRVGVAAAIAGHLLEQFRIGLGNLVRLAGYRLGEGLRRQGRRSWPTRGGRENFFGDLRSRSGRSGIRLRTRLRPGRAPKKAEPDRCRQDNRDDAACHDRFFRTRGGGRGRPLTARLCQGSLPTGRRPSWR